MPKSVDLVALLRSHPVDDADLLDVAADEIERLRALCTLSPDSGDLLERLHSVVDHTRTGVDPVWLRMAISEIERLQACCKECAQPGMVELCDDGVFRDDCSASPSSSCGCRA